MKKGKIFSILTSAAMVFSLAMPVGVSAAEYTNVSTLDGLTSALSDGESVKLTNNIELINGLTIASGKDVTIDLNGKKLTAYNEENKNIIVNGNLTIKDSSEKADGQIYSDTVWKNAATGHSLIDVENGTVKLDSGNINSVAKDNGDGNYAVTLKGTNSKFNMTGGKITAGYFCVTLHGKNEYKGGTINITGGELVSTQDYAIYAAMVNGNVTVKNATVTGATGAISMRRGELTVENSNLKNGNTGNTGDYSDGTGNQSNNAIILEPSSGDINATVKNTNVTGRVSLINKDYKASLDVTGGTFSSTTDAFEVQKNCTLTIDGATVTGGTSNNGANTAVWADGGNVTINGGTFTTGYDDEGNGNSTIYAKRGGIITINGGTFSSERICTSFEPDQYGLLNIHDGTRNESKIIVKGGTFKHEFNPANNSSEGLNTNFVADGYTSYKVGENYIVAKANTAIVAPEKLTIEKGKTTEINATWNGLKDLTYTSDKESVAKVDVNGKVTAVGKGTTNITVTLNDTVKTTVKVSVYELTTDTKTEEGTTVANTTESTLTTTTNKLVEQVLSDANDITAISDETANSLKQAIEDGKTITTEVRVEIIDKNGLSESTLEKIESLAKDNEVALFLDLSVMLKAENEELGTINELSDEIEFTIDVPEELLKDGRTFYIIRLHDDVAERIDGTLKDGKFTFKTNKFSLYALAYEEKPEVAGKEDTKADTTTKEDKKTDKVKTGDNTNTMLYVELGAMALVGCAILFLQSKRSELLNK